MKKLDAMRRVKEIDNSCSDDQQAHYEEDSLFYDFVKAIIDGKYRSKKEIIEVANEVYKVRDLDFARWYS